jgi:Tat protein translocase TatB subunit
MLSVPHLVIIFLVALIVLGPDKLPQMARTLGKAMADFRRITTDFRVQVEDEMREMERQTRIKQMNEESIRTAEEASTQLLGATPAEEPQPVPATAVASEKPANGESQPV